VPGVAGVAGPGAGDDHGVYLGASGEWLARLTVEDPLRPNAAPARSTPISAVEELN